MGAKIADIGCTGFSIVDMARWLDRPDLIQAGVDSMPLVAPENCEFKQADLDVHAIPFPDDSFDLVVASHIIEHLRDPIKFCSDLIRITKPGGSLYIEAPSERSVMLPGMPFDHDRFCSLSFYDDPTHQSRPWSPQAFHRLFRYLGCVPLKTGYHTSLRVRLMFPLLFLGAYVLQNARLLEFCIWRGVGWCSYAIITKPKELNGPPQFRYYYSSK
jgi:SAM-dependent methyltransferase